MKSSHKCEKSNQMGKWIDYEKLSRLYMRRFDQDIIQVDSNNSKYQVILYHLLYITSLTCFLIGWQ